MWRSKGWEKAQVSRNEKKVFDGRLIKVFSKHQKLPNGKKTYLEKVHHPGAAVIVPLVKQKVVMIRQYRPVIDKYIWELPAGTLDAGEKPGTCAKREIREETGYIAKRIERLGYIYTTPGFCNEKIHIYRIWCEEKKDQKKEEDEIISVRLMTRSQICKRFRKGLITDAKTIAALKFADLL
ncbi:MAG: NUDIX domain-containing protein [Candidatus Omnitrophica bacterium]|nr:NUDIX domain-containing protein [Candidatus Omnitrophota bacterium]